ncbi:MAG: dynamin family protein [Actinomycetota bacterium]|nr:dynamin family protein [Actinomycetota bacterium]
MDASIPATPAEKSPVVIARRFVTAGIDRCTALGRDDLAQRLHHALARLDEPSTVLYVAGEYKQGKSLLVNALVGDDACPVDDDLSTSTITWIDHHDPPVASIRRRDRGTTVDEAIPLDDVWKYASERGNPGNRRNVDVVHIGLPSRVLATGLTFIDSPGAGALRGGAAQAAISFLPYADALIFVTDASAELSALEIRFLQDALKVCPTVLVALTKIDLYPEWERIADMDRAHLADAGLPDAVAPVSSTLRLAALERSDARVNDESGFPAFLAELRSSILDNARMRATSRALTETSTALSLLLASLRTEQRALADPDSARDLIDELNDARARLGVLRVSGARWSTLLGDGITDLNQGIDGHLKSSFRDLLGQSDDRLGDGDPTVRWESITDDLRASVVTLARDTFEQVQTGADEITERVAEALRDAGLQAPEIAAPAGVDLGEIWELSDRSPRPEKRGPLAAGLGVLRGTSSGVILLGVMSNLAGIAIAAPVTIGVGVLFGAKQIVDERRRLLEQRRQRARTVVRQYLAEAQTELSIESRKAVQEVHRLLRDSFSQQITDLNSTLTHSIRTIEGSLAVTEQTRAERLPLLSEQIEHLERLIEQTDAQTEHIEGRAP